MSEVYYDVSLTVSADKREKGGETAKNLVELWKSGTDTEDMEITFDESTGGFTLDTKQVVGISPALMDDTTLMLQELGAYAEKGAVVHHSYYGENRDFVIGPNEEARKEAVQADEIARAIKHLNKAKNRAPASHHADIDKLIASLQELI
jgi:hypothetical protein